MIGELLGTSIAASNAGGKIMKLRKSHMLAVILFPAIVAGCTNVNSASRESVSREKVVENLSPILDMEQRHRTYPCHAEASFRRQAIAG